MEQLLDTFFADLHTIIKPIDACLDLAMHAGHCEKQWAEKIKVDWRKQQFLAVWGFVRLELSKFLNIPADDIIFLRTDYGKPYIKNPNIDLSFNISHTKNHIALCYRKNIKACGIDIEIPRDMEDMLSIAKRFYAPEEFAFINSLDHKEKQKYYFFKLWVIKEALLKTIGKGLSFGLDKVCIADFENNNQGVIELNYESQIKKLAWQFCDNNKKDYLKAIAIEV